MKIETLFFSEEKWQYEDEFITDKDSVDLVLLFGDTDILEKNIHYAF